MKVTSLVAIIIVGLFFFSGLGGAVSFFFSKYEEAKEKADAYEAQAEATANTLTEFGEMVAKDIEEYAINNTVLQKAYGDAYKEELNFNARIETIDFNKVAAEKPNSIERAINIELIRMHNEIRKITGYTETGSTQPTATTETITGESFTR